ncbi:MAG: 30S ribosomal protein S12 methylthiotransferase RimO [Planctomycetia bacterium]|nr:30S ribosomal protein S12 methylthiotransferase RimO [Planctomycetia bacterium]
MKTCAIISLGCPKNLVDSEQMLGQLARQDFQVVLEPEDADIVIINTCGFLAASREEGLENIHAMERLRRNPNERLACLIVAGCLVSRDKESLVAQCPDVDAFLDVFSRDEVQNAVRQTLDGTLEKRLFLGTTEEIAKDDTRFPLLPAHVAYLKIAEGCNRRCAFCAIPNIRGRYSSKPMDLLLAEAKALAQNGVRELVLIAQDTSRYGSDLDDPHATLANLLKALSQIDGILWIRVLYLYPQNFGDDLIDALAETPKVVPYIDMPLQHINNRILKSMRRAVTREKTLELLEKLRTRLPQLAIRTAFIVGYPGETQAEFDELLAFIRKQRFPRLGVFQYSPEEGTPAAEMERQVPEKISRKRAEAVMKLQKQISSEWVRSLVGTVQEVLVDAQLEDGRWMGRTMFDAPDIDGHVFFTADNIMPGQRVLCEITGGDAYDLIGNVHPDL